MTGRANSSGELTNAGPKGGALFVTTHSLQWGVVEELGVAQIAAVLERAGWPVVVRAIPDNDDKALLELQKELTTSHSLLLVGIACSHRTPDLGSLKLLCNLIKQAIPAVHLTAGGYWASFNFRELLEQLPDLDSVVIGEGELSVLQLIRELQHDGEWNSLPGIATRTVHNGRSPITHNLDTLPFPKRTPGTSQRDDEIASISTSRGCMAHCTFCNVPAWMREFGGGAWRGRTVENVADEISNVVSQHGLRRFWFVDSSFEDPLPNGLDRMRALANEVLARGLDIRFYTFHRAESIANAITPDLLQLLVHAGLRRVFVGFESGSDKTLKGFAKGARRSDIRSALQVLRDARVAVRCGFIMFTPDTSQESLLENLTALRESDLLFSTTDLLTRLELYTGSSEVTKLKGRGLVSGEVWRDPYAYRFLDERARWLTERLCPLRTQLAKDAYWEALHTADLIAISAMHDSRVTRSGRLMKQLGSFLKEIRDLKETLTISNETFMSAAVALAWGDRSEARLRKLIARHLLHDHVTIASTASSIATEFLLEVRVRIPAFAY